MMYPFDDRTCVCHQNLPCFMTCARLIGRSFVVDRWPLVVGGLLAGWLVCKVYDCHLVMNLTYCAVVAMAVLLGPDPKDAK
jgi:hypothetical protein